MTAKAMTPKQDQLAAAILNTLISSNECDRNFENANVVDGLFAIARAINGLARAVEEASQSKSQEPQR